MALGQTVEAAREVEAMLVSGLLQASGTVACLMITATTDITGKQRRVSGSGVVPSLVPTPATRGVAATCRLSSPVAVSDIAMLRLPPPVPLGNVPMLWFVFEGRHCFYAGLQQDHARFLIICVGSSKDLYFCSPVAAGSSEKGEKFRLCCGRNSSGCHF
jgi:hypothetical protein